MIVTMILLELISNAKAPYTDVYNFPMLGVLEFDTGTSRRAYGSVTIAHSQLALCCSENILQIEPGGREYITDPGSVENLYVFAGTDLLHPPTWYEATKVKKVKVAEIFLAKDTKWVGAIDDQVLSKRLNRFLEAYKSSAAPLPEAVPLNNTEGFLKGEAWVFNPFHELQWDVGFLVLESKLTWSPYVLPIPNFFWTQSSQLAKAHIDAWNAIQSVERTPHYFPPCSVPGWSPAGNNEIIYHRVVYIRHKECEEAICGSYPSSCLKYLNSRHHVCFKSLNFADSCVLDQGAPVLCSWFPNKVVGILTRTFECGTQNLPSVFTRLDTIAVFAALAQLPAKYAQQEPKLDDPSYTETPNI